MLASMSSEPLTGRGAIRSQSDHAWIELALIGAFFVLLAALYLRLTPGRFLSGIAPDLGDPLFNLSIMRWGASRVDIAFTDLWNPTFFFPAKGALALSDHLLGPAILYRLLDGMGLSPAGAYNTLLLLAFAGSGTSCYWILRRSQLSVLGALGGAITWTFCGFRWSALSHIQVLLALGVPVTLWLFHRLLFSPTWMSAGKFLGAYALQLSAGGYLAMMIHVPLLAITWVHAGEFSAKSVRELRKAPLVAAAAASAAMLWITFLPYLTLRRSVAPPTSIIELVPYMVTLKSYLSVGARTAYSDWFPSQLRGHAQLWPGFVAAGLFFLGATLYLQRRLKSGPGLPKVHTWLLGAILACCLLSLVAADLCVWAGGLRSQRELRATLYVFRATAGVLVLAWMFWLGRRSSWLEEARSQVDVWWKSMVALSLLTVLVSHVAVFVLLREWIPGFDAIRVPGRFFVFSSFGLAALVGLGLDRLARATSRPNIAALSQGLVIVLLACEFIPSGKYIEWQEIPPKDGLKPEYRWLEEHDDVHAFLELPFLENWQEAERMYFWSIHQRPMVNGYSGFLPQPYQLLKEETGRLPDGEVLSRLERLGVSHLVVHLDAYSSVERRDWRIRQKKFMEAPGVSLQLVYEASWTMVYRILKQPE